MSHNRKLLRFRRLASVIQDELRCGLRCGSVWFRHTRQIPLPEELVNMLKARRKKSEDKLGHKSLTTTEKYLAESDLKATHMRALADKAFSF